ncbi:hypothetical protein SAMN05216226_104122 [Halovenus aranensis]|uniref:DUF7312 domain-containing protein n=1 Tax=Halovenus aranensis TaxID=890420 RepID=A0A1G8U9A3_9EURY|nr:hypothetical protein [Halovenus aranensis]SDJ50352.1 hypothetical protein SAMN05216226_104122 [Halovenus aranensis]
MATQDDEDDEWRFSLDDLDDGEVSETATDASGDGDGNIAGTLETRQPLEPGDIDLENAVFVALGVLIVVGLILGAVLGF